MAMKKILVFLLLAALFSCSDNKNIPDVSDIKVDITVKRFEQELFSIDSNNTTQGVNMLFQRYPVLAPIFLQNILGLDSSSADTGLKRFLDLSQPVYEAANKQFKDFET